MNTDVIKVVESGEPFSAAACLTKFRFSVLTINQLDEILVSSVHSYYLY